MDVCLGARGKHKLGGLVRNLVRVPSLRNIRQQIPERYAGIISAQFHGDVDPGDMLQDDGRLLIVVADLRLLSHNGGPGFIPGAGFHGSHRKTVVKLSDARF